MAGGVVQGVECGIEIAPTAYPVVFEDFHAFEQLSLFGKDDGKVAMVIGFNCGDDGIADLKVMKKVLVQLCLCCSFAEDFPHVGKD